uniref:C3a anaphylatoxin chemotactic receptor n=1 Tax=Ursus americanus TaxID=9643 RepID=A0A452SAL1_URSAM
MEPFSADNNSTDLPSQPWYEPQVILSMVILSLTFLLGLPGNGLVLWVAGLKMQRTVNTVWFLHLTLADFLCCLSLPFSLAHLALQGHWPYGWLLCKLIPSIIVLNMFASVFLLTAISLDRCLLVLKPIWCQNHRNVGTAFLPGEIDDRLESFSLQTNDLPWTATTILYSQTFQRPSGEALPMDSATLSGQHLLVVGFLLPFIVMVTCYGLIIFRMRRGRFTKTRIKTLRVAMAVVVVFCVCWAPYHIVGVLSLFYDPETPFGEALLSWDHVSIALASANSCFNPFLYALLGKDFRKKAKQSVKGILEAAFSEDLTQSTSCPQSKVFLERNSISTTV